MSSTYQVSIKDEESTRLNAAMKIRKDIKDGLHKDAIKIFAMERIDEILGDKK
jgi:hypothetical protein